MVCITHLAQVAAQAHAHLIVHKAAEAGATAADLTEAGGEKRVGEIARMLGGLEITEQTLAHAREMLEASER